MGERSRRWARLAVGIALSAAALALALRRVSFADLSASLEAADWRWLPAMLALKALVLVVKDLRWRVELQAMAPGPYRATFRAICLGYFGNLILPFRLGELLRVGLLVRHNRSASAGDTLATVAAERAIDGAVLAAMVFAALPAATVPPWMLRGTLLVAAIMLAVIAAGMLAPVHRWLMARLPERGAGGLLRKVVAAGSRGTAVLRRPGPLALTVLWTVVGWLGECLVLYLGVLALDLPLGFPATMVVTLLMSVGLLIPSAPGQLGTHQALTIFFLQPFGVSDASALSLSIILQATALLTMGSLGGWVLLSEAAARDLVRHADRVE
jgi:glycosyltransferase 2 family protein